MNNPTREEIIKSIEPKSDQLNADDLISGPITVTITGVKRGDREQPVVVEIEGHRPYKPCKTMRRVLIATFSDDPLAWVGQQLTLYCDPSVMWGGVRVGGIRISHLSGLTEPKTFLLTHARGKRTEVTIMPIAGEDDKALIAEAKHEIATSETMNQLKAVGFILKTRPKSVQDAVRQIYVARQTELSTEPEGE